MTEAQSELGNVAALLRIEQKEDFRLHEIYLSQKSIQERRLAGLTWFPLKIIETGFGLGAYPYLVVENPGEKHRHQFQSSSPVSLFSLAEGNQGQSLKGTIGYVDDTRMKITFMVDELPDWTDDGKLGVEKKDGSKNYARSFSEKHPLFF
jgi:ATP-dependent RNA/DNA helicase IGHMBP2